jgi:DHA1 family quinolone resistance protein-like MFS transporter
MNKIIKYLMLSDICIFTGFGLISPILAIFIKEDVRGGTIFAAGLATTIFMIVKGVIQLPFSRYIDKHDDKLKWLKVGTLIIAIVPVLYIFVKDVTHIYLVEVLHGIGSGLAFPTWLGMWSTHLDKGHESFEWSLYSTLVGAGAAITAGIGAALAQYIGFNFTFLLVAIFSFFGFLLLFGLGPQKDRKGKISSTQYHIKRKVLNQHSGGR